MRVWEGYLGEDGGLFDLVVDFRDIIGGMVLGKFENG